MPFYYRSDAPSIPTKKPGSPSQGSPLRNPGKQSIPDMTKALKNLDDILAYTRDVYGGDRSTYWTNRNAIDAQHGYNEKRKNAGLKPLAIADPQWNPNEQDDDANEALAQWYKRHGSLPRDDQQLAYNRLLGLYRAEKRMHGGEGAARPAGFVPETGFAATLDARPVRAADDVTTAQITQGWQTAQGPSSPTALDAQPTWGLPTATLQGMGGGLSMLWGNNMDAPSVPSAQTTPQPHEKSLYQKIDEALVPVSKWTGRVLNAPQALYLNAWNALFNAVQGRPVEYNPDITGAQYAAERAAAVGAPEANIPEGMANFIQNDGTRKILANALGLPEDSKPVEVIEGVRRVAAQMPYEAATDPTTFFGIAEIQALGRGGRALKIGDPKYETALRSNKVNGGLKLVDDPSAWQFDEAYPTLAQDAGQGYTQAGSRARETLEDAVAAARRGTEDAGTLYTKDSLVPKDILNTKPHYSPVVDKWLESGGQITIENGTWKYTDSTGISVVYKNGHPDFKGSGHVLQEVDIGPIRTRSSDFRLADRMAPNGPKSPLNTWHHHEDSRTLQEVNRRIHGLFTHRGGVSIVRKGGR